MKNKKIKDERVVQMTNKILGETYLVMVLLMTISILVKMYVLKIDYTNYITELAILILSTIYMAIRSITAGYDLMSTSKRSKIRWILVGLGLSIIITVINGVKNYVNYGEHYSGILDVHFLAALAFIFISSLTIIFVVLLFFYLCHKIGQQRIEKKLNDDDVEED